MTMYRYMALMWSRTDQEASRAAKLLAAKLHKVSPHQWSLAWDGAGLAIYHSGEHKGRMQTYHLTGERGAVLGRLFRNDYTSVVDDLDEFESRKCLETRGQRLIDDYWGNYVAFLSDPATGTRYIMRDPTGAFPCFHTPFRGVTIYFSDMQDVANFDFLPFTVNLRFLKAEIILPQCQKTITGLNEVSEVLPAECVEVTPFEKKSRFVWNPTEISQTNVVEDPENAAELLRETVKCTICALASCYDRIIHNLGGLDSSIALAVMAQSPKRPEITCVTNFTKSPGGDERFYSRQVAERFDVPLIEKELNYNNINLTSLFNASKTARPPAGIDFISLAMEELQIVKKTDSHARFSGVGGDNVFYQPPVNLGGLDFIRLNGIRKDVLKVAMEASRHGRKSLVTTIHDMVREGLSPSPCFDIVYDTILQNYKIPFISPAFAEPVQYKNFLHPHLIPAPHDPKGKYLHILMCAFFAREYYHARDVGYCPPRVHTFCAQPIVELCLRIPVWVLTYGGVERGLARKAFRSDLPRDVIRRYSKSAPSGFYRDVFEHNIELLRGALLDGILVREKILLRSQLEKSFCKDDIFLHVWHSQILRYFDTEIWLKGWMERRVDRSREIVGEKI